MVLTDGDIEVALERLPPFLPNAGSKETSADPAHWSYENSAWGQCAVTALVVERFFGGEIIRLDLSRAPDPSIAALRSHYFNRIRGRMFDLTESQFPRTQFYKDLLERGAITARDKKELFAAPNTRKRYELLLAEITRMNGDDIVIN